MRYDVYITKRDQVYIAAVPALPGCATLGRSEAEVLSNIRDVIEGYLLLLQKRRQPFPRTKVVKVHHARYPVVRSA
ncbi:MAG: type II toxin-antitoxin system HicB family antitoxin [Nitrospirae bacterium]|nr:type II toxin-antitoxin system HicB family antitoxin [Nitrospirota bacterium]